MAEGFAISRQSALREKWNPILLEQHMRWKLW